MRKCAAVALLITAVVVPVVNVAAPKVTAGDRCPCRVQRCAGGDARAGDRDRRPARRHGAGAGAVRLGATDPQRCAAAGTGPDDEPVAVQRRRTRPARCRRRPRLPGQRIRLPVLHPAEPGRSGRLRQPRQPVHDDRRHDRPEQRGRAGRQHLVERRQPQRRRPRDRRRRLPVRLGRRRRRRPARRLQPEQRRPGPQPAQRQDPARRAVDRRACARQPDQRAGHAPAAEFAATCRRRRRRSARRSTPGACATRSASPSTPTPVRDRFFINDVGQSTREEVDQGGIGAQLRLADPRGRLPASARTRRARRRPGAGSPNRSPTTRARVGQVITAGAFIPNGHWPAEYDGGYLFADAGSGNMWLRRADGSIDYAAPFATGVGGIADMAFVTDHDSIALYYTLTGGSVRKITPADRRRSLHRARCRSSPVPPGTRVLDTRLPTRRRQAGAGQHHALRADGCRPGGDQGRAGQLRVRHAEHLGLPHGLGRTKRATGGVEHQRLPPARSWPTRRSCRSMPTAAS